MFYRGRDGEAKFSLRIFSLAGIQSSIDGTTKTFVLSGKVRIDGQGSLGGGGGGGGCTGGAGSGDNCDAADGLLSGELDVDSRDDAFRRVVGEFDRKIPFWQLKCSVTQDAEGNPEFTRINVRIPKLELEKATDELVPLTDDDGTKITDDRGAPVLVTPKVRWVETTDDNSGDDGKTWFTMAGGQG